MCAIPQAAAKVAERGLGVRSTLCTQCAQREGCAYLLQEVEIERLAREPQGLVLFASHNYATCRTPGDVTPDLYIHDEALRDLM